MRMRVLVQTLIVGSLGAFLAWLLHVPAPFLLGPASAVTLAALAGLRMGLPDGLRDVAFVLIGLGMGAGVTPEVLAAAASWPLSLLILLLAVIVILWGGRALLQAALRMDRRTAALAAAPGHLSYVLGLGLEARADLQLLTVIQSLRVLALTLLTPPLVMILQGAPLPRGLPPGSSMAPGVLVPLAVVAAMLGLGLKRLRIPAAMLLGAMLASAVAHGGGLAVGGVPGWLAVPGLVVMGSLIGSRFSGVTLVTVRRAFAGALLLTGLAVAVACAAAWAAATLLGLPLTPALIAFAPGGVETMVALALLLDADPAYVALHHVFRLFALTFLIPLALGRAP